MEDLQDCAKTHMRQWNGSLLVEQARDSERIRHADSVVQRLDLKKAEVGRIALQGLPEPVVTLGLCLCSLPQGPGGRSKGKDPTQNPTITSKVAQRTLDKRHTAAVSKFKTKVESLAAAIQQAIQDSNAPAAPQAAPQSGRSNSSSSSSSSTGTTAPRSRSAPPRSTAAAELGAAPTPDTPSPVGESKRSWQQGPAQLQGVKLRLPVKRHKSQQWGSSRDTVPQPDQDRLQDAAVPCPAELGTDAQLLLLQDSPTAAGERGSLAPATAAAAGEGCSTAAVRGVETVVATSRFAQSGAAGSTYSPAPAAAVDSMLIDEPPARGPFAGVPVEQQQLSKNAALDSLMETDVDFPALLDELLLNAAVDAQGCGLTQQQGGGGPRPQLQCGDRTALLSAPPPAAAAPVDRLLCPSSAAGVQGSQSAAAGLLVSGAMQSGRGSGIGCPPCSAGPVPVELLPLRQQQLQLASHAGRLGAPPALAARQQPLRLHATSSWRGAGAAAASVGGPSSSGSSSSLAGLPAVPLPARPPQQVQLYGQGSDNLAASAQQGLGRALDALQAREAVNNGDLRPYLLQCLQLAAPGSALQQVLLEAVVSSSRPLRPESTAAAAPGNTMQGMLQRPPAAAVGMLPLAAGHGSSRYGALGQGSQDGLASSCGYSATLLCTNGYAGAPAPAAAAGGGGLLGAYSDTTWLWQLVGNVADSNSVLDMVSAASQAMQGLAGAAAQGYDVRPHSSLLRCVLTQACRQQEFAMLGGAVVAQSLPLQQPLSPGEVAAAFRGVEEAMANLAALAGVTNLTPPAPAQPATPPVRVPVPGPGSSAGALAPGWAPAAAAAGTSAAHGPQAGVAAEQGGVMLAFEQGRDVGMGDTPGWFEDAVMLAMLQEF